MMLFKFFLEEVFISFPVLTVRQWLHSHRSRSINADETVRFCWALIQLNYLRRKQAYLRYYRGVE
jgi:hypothetical protein